MFLYSITSFLNKNINKHFSSFSGDTNNITFSLYNILYFNPIKIYAKLHVNFCMNGMILGEEK
jgi:hypothetical protein